MLSVLKWLVMRLAAVRWIVKILASLGLLVPLIALFKVIGLPILAILGILALPVLFVLFIFGLPIFLVLIVGGGILGLVFAALSFGLVVLKFAIFVVLPIYLVFKLLGWIFGRGRRKGDPGTPPSTTTPPADATEPPL